MQNFKLVSRNCAAFDPALLTDYGPDTARAVRAFHRSFPMYTETPLVQLPGAAATLGLGEIFIKDESYRFGLNAFKVLGGSYAMGKVLSGRMQASEMHYSSLTSPEARAALGDLTFVTATDGNHGRGVAWAAKRFGFKSVVYMPKGTVAERLENILREGADASITEFNYDECVRIASRQSEEKGWIMVQDTAWDGYEDVPRWIMQGYSTMALEAHEQLSKRPTHIFLQAGVGSMAAAVAAFFACAWPGEKPTITIVEPNKADCFYRSALANDGSRHFVTGDMDTIMAGLACGEPCSIAWDILSQIADHYISCPDYAAAQGMRILGNPAMGDQRIISGESGASAFGCVCEIMSDPALAPIRDAIGLDRDSVCLFFSTEGDTDRANYRAIVSDGAHPRPAETRPIEMD